MYFPTLDWTHVEWLDRITAVIDIFIFGIERHLAHAIVFIAVGAWRLVVLAWLGVLWLLCKLTKGG
jgi:hypothetical protein